MPSNAKQKDRNPLLTIGAKSLNNRVFV